MFMFVIVSSHDCTSSLILLTFFKKLPIIVINKIRRLLVLLRPLRQIWTENIKTATNLN